MELGRFYSILSGRFALGKLISPRLCQQQLYHGPPSLSRDQAARIERQKKPFIPDEASMPHLKPWQKTPEGIQRYKRVAWAKFGSASGIDLKGILPTKEEIEAEWEAEKEWWPTLQEMQEDVKYEKEMKEDKKAAYEKRVAENMAKMPKWIEQFKDEQLKLKEKEKELKIRKDAQRQKLLEELNYNVDPKSREFREHLRKFVERERMLKKQAKKVAKKMKRQ